MNRRCPGSLLTIAVVLLASAAGGLRASRQPPSYRAECVVDLGREPQVLDGADSDDWYRTQAYVFASSSIRELAAQQLRLGSDHSFMAFRMIERIRGIEKAPAVLLGERVSVERIEGTRLLRVSIVDSKPARAAAIVNAMADSYVQKTDHDRTGTAGRALTWLTSEAERAGQRLAATQGELASFYQRGDSSALSIDEQLHTLKAELEQLNVRISDARIRRIELLARVNALKAQARDDPFGMHSAEIEDKQGVQQLRTDYLASSLKAAEIEAAQGPASPSLAIVRARREILSQEMKSTVEGVLAQAQLEFEAAQRLESQLEPLRDQINTRGRLLQLEKLELDRIVRERSEAEALLKMLRERSATANLVASEAQLAATIIDRAAPPLHAVPAPILDDAVWGALLGGLAMALLRITRRDVQSSRTAPGVSDGRISG